MIKEYRANDPETVAIFNKYQIHILPVANPDGYEYSHTGQRLWRKNRKLNWGATCVGVDLNRNWGYKWMVGIYLILSILKINVNCYFCLLDGRRQQLSML